MINNKWDEEQFGFRWYLKTEKATYELINGILSPLNKKLIVRGIFYDLAEALIVLTMIFYCPN